MSRSRICLFEALRIIVVAASLPVVSPAPAQTSPSQWVIGETIELESRILSETRQLTIGTPYGYDTGDDSYPVLYLLDGPDHFHHTTGTTRYLARNRRIPEMLVVAVANTDRSRDLTPPSLEEDEIARLPTHGGADNFRRFMREELVPWVDQNYRTVPHRILVGHSLGGLFAIHTLVSDSEIFDSYIAVSPSLNWNDQRLLNRAEAFFENTPVLDARLFMSVGNEGGALLGGVRKLSGVLDELAPTGFGWKFTWMPDETHGSVPLPSTIQGLEFVFSDYYLTDVLGKFDEQGLDGIKEYFAKSGRRLGIERKPPLNSLFALLNGLIVAERWDEMVMLVELDPETFSPPIDDLLRTQAWTFLAQGYANDENPDRAAEFYRKLLEADPSNEGARNALRELGGTDIE